MPFSKTKRAKYCSECGELHSQCTNGSCKVYFCNRCDTKECPSCTSFLDVVVPLKPREVFPEKFGAI